jgi:broad specificity phosphatase PhoE
MLRFFFVRHAESEANVLGIFSNIGWKHPLTDLGRMQAKRLAEFLANEKVTRIFSSPVMRAVQTSEILSERLGIPFTVAAGLREYDVGVFEGLPIEAGKELKREVEAAWYYQKDYARCLPGGESFLDIRARFTLFVQEQIDAFRYTDETVVLVSHGGIFYAMLPEILANVSWIEMQTRKFSNTGFVVAELQPDGSLLCVDWKSEISV